jgi:hypothetical protein
MDGPVLWVVVGVVGVLLLIMLARMVRGRRPATAPGGRRWRWRRRY